eukprot:1736674-Pleurochrysis_carterae.AAC.1
MESVGQLSVRAPLHDYSILHKGSACARPSRWCRARKLDCCGGAACVSVQCESLLGCDADDKLQVTAGTFVLACRVQVPTLVTYRV